MSESNGSNSEDKKTKVRRQPKPESVLTPTFAASRHNTSGTLWDRNQQGGGLLQRQCVCGTHTIGGGECDGCRRKREGSFLQRSDVTQLAENEGGQLSNGPQTSPASGPNYNFSEIPVRSGDTKQDQTDGTRQPAIRSHLASGTTEPAKAVIQRKGTLRNTVDNIKGTWQEFEGKHQQIKRELEGRFLPRLKAYSQQGMRELFSPSLLSSASSTHPSSSSASPTFSFSPSAFPPNLSTQLGGIPGRFEVPSGSPGTSPQSTYVTKGAGLQLEFPGALSSLSPKKEEVKQVASGLEHWVTEAVEGADRYFAEFRGGTEFAVDPLRIRFGQNTTTDPDFSIDTTAYESKSIISDRVNNVDVMIRQARGQLTKRQQNAEGQRYTGWIGYIEIKNKGNTWPFTPTDRQDPWEKGPSAFVSDKQIAHRAQARKLQPQSKDGRNIFWPAGSSKHIIVVRYFARGIDRTVRIML